MKEYRLIIPTATAVSYLEYDRRKNPAPVVPIFQMDSVDSIKESFKSEGRKQPVTLQFAVINGKGIIHDGCHRTMAMHELMKEGHKGYENVAVKMRVYGSYDELFNDVDPTTAMKMIPLESSMRNRVHSFKAL